MDQLNMMTTLFKKATGVITLLDKSRKTVGAIYIDRLPDIERLIVVEPVGVEEKYYVFIAGVGIFFTYYTIS